MKTMLRSIISFALLLSGVIVQAQDCENLTFVVFSNLGLGGPENFQMNILDAEGNYVLEFDAITFGELSIEFLTGCLDPEGCYSAEVFFTASENAELLEFVMETDLGAPVFPMNFYYLPGGEYVSFQFSFSNDCPAYDCPKDFFLDTQVDCGGIVAEIGSFVEGEEVLWNYGDGVVAEGGHFTSYNYTENGTYDVSAIYVTPTCRANYGGQITIDCFGNDCPEELTYEAMGEECGSFLFSIPDVDQETDGINWYVGDDLVDENAGPLFDYTFPEEGNYSVCATMENDLCPDGVELCAELEVVCAEPECGLEVAFEGGDCGPIVFTATPENELEEVFWWIDGEDITSTGETFTLEPWEAGLYVVCAGIESEACPFGNVVCTTIEVPEACFETACPEEIWSGLGKPCGVMLFEMGSFQEGESVDWDFGDDQTATGGHYITHTYAQNGTYEVCGVFTSDDCPDGVSLCTEIVVDCFSEECEPEWAWEAVSCSSWVFETAAPDAEWWGWYVNGVLIEDNVLVFDYTVESSGYYNVCLEFQNEACGLVTLCEEVVVYDDCFNEICDLGASIMDDPECGPYIFTAASGEPEGPLYWWVEGTEISSEGNVFTFMPEEAGVYTVCVTNESPTCPFGAQECFTIEVPESCFETPCEGELSFEETGDGCGDFVFWIPGLGELNEVTWYIGDLAIEAGPEYAYTFPEDGAHTVCAFYYTEACPEGIEDCVSLTVFCDEPECTEVSLGFDLSSEGVSLDALDWSIYDGDFNPVAADECIYDGTQWCDAVACLGEGCHTLYFNFYPALESQDDLTLVGSFGEEQNLVFYNVFWAEDLSEATFEISVDGSCGEVMNDCPTQDDFYAGALDDCAWMEFEIGSFAEGELVIWTFGDGTTVTGGHYIQHEYPEGGEYEVCAFFTSNDCPNGVEICETVEVEGCGCTNVDLFFDSNLDLGGPTSLTGLLLNSALEPVANFFECNYGESGFCDISVCLTDDCYSIALQLGLGIDAAGFEYGVHIDGESLDLIPVLENYDFGLVSFQFGVNAPCTDHIAEEPTEVLAAYPNPSLGEVQLNYTGKSQSQALVLDQTGRLVQSLLLTGPGQYVLQDLAVGVYTVAVESNGVLRQTLQLIVH